MMIGGSRNHDCGPRSAAVVLTQVCKRTRPTEPNALSGRLERCHLKHKPFPASPKGSLFEVRDAVSHYLSEDQPCLTVTRPQFPILASPLISRHCGEVIRLSK